MTKFQGRPEAVGTASTTTTSSDDVVYVGVERRHIPRALPVPEVVETDDADAWAMWQESVTQIDSQLPTEPAPLEALPEQGDSGSATKDIADPHDPFASIHRRSH